MPAASFDNLPTEIKSQVIDYLEAGPLSGNLRNLALASKQWAPISLDGLYHTIILCVSDHECTKRQPHGLYLGTRNSNLARVKHVRLRSYRPENARPAPGTQNASSVITRVISTLKAASLQGIDFGPCELSFQSFMSLVSQQSGLRSVNFNGLVSQHPKKSEGEDSIIAANLSCLSNLQSLTMNGPWPDDDRLQTSDLLNMLFTRTSLGCSVQAADLVPSLTSLDLRYVVLESYSPRPMIDLLGHLKRLALRECVSSFTILDHLTGHLKLMDAIDRSDLPLQHLLISHVVPEQIVNEGIYPDRLCASLDSLLQFDLGLTSLCFQVSCTNLLPRSEGIVRNVGSLKVLRIHTFSGPMAGTSDPDNVYNVAEFEEICSHAKSLEELSCTFPGVNIERYPGKSFRRYSAAIVNIATLRLLQITTWPLHGEFPTQQSPYVYDMGLKEVANFIFQQAHGDLREFRKWYEPAMLNVKKSGRLKYVAFGDIATVVNGPHDSLAFNVGYLFKHRSGFDESGYKISATVEVERKARPCQREIGNFTLAVEISVAGLALPLSAVYDESSPDEDDDA